MANLQRFPQSLGRVWQFKTKRFCVALTLERQRGYRYDGDDEDGEVQAKLDDGEYVAFLAKVSVELDGEEIAADYLGGSVYEAEQVADFYQAHWTSSYEGRNTMELKARNCAIGHYFPDMVRQAIAEARGTIEARKAIAARLPIMRTA